MWSRSRLAAAKESVELGEQRLDYEEDGDGDHGVQVLRPNRKKARVVYLRNVYFSPDTIKVLHQLNVRDIVQTVAT
jgi:hypothetical protein